MMNKIIANLKLDRIENSSERKLILDDYTSHYSKYKKVLEEISPRDIDAKKLIISHYRKNWSKKDKLLETDIYSDSCSPIKRSDFISSMELTDEKLSLMKWKKLKKLESLNITKDFELLKYEEKVKLLKKYSVNPTEGRADINNIVNDCTDHMTSSDLDVINGLIFFSGLNGGAELAVSIPLSYKIGACIGFIRMAPIIALYLDPGFCYEILNLFKNKIRAKTIYRQIPVQSSPFIVNRRYFIYFGTSLGVAAYMAYNDKNVSEFWKSFQNPMSGEKYDLTLFLGSDWTKILQDLIHGTESVAYTITSTLSRIQIAIFSGIYGPILDTLLEALKGKKRN